MLVDILIAIWIRAIFSFYSFSLQADHMLMILNGIPDNIKNKFQLDFGSMLVIWNILIFISRYVPTERNIFIICATDEMSLSGHTSPAFLHQTL